MKLNFRCALVAAAFALTGCGDPIEGEWVSTRDELVTLDVQSGNETDGWDGVGETGTCLDDGECRNCKYDFHITLKGDVYHLEGTFTGPCASKGAHTPMDCTLDGGAETLSCEKELGSPSEYEKK